MRRCSICRERQAEWAWQPCGPGEDLRCFSVPGWHYRGFMAVAICDACKRRIEAGEDVEFRHRGVRLVAVGATQRVERREMCLSEP